MDFLIKYHGNGRETELVRYDLFPSLLLPAKDIADLSER